VIEHPGQSFRKPEAAGEARSINDRDDAWVEEELRSLDPGAQDILAALAVCGRGSLSVDQLIEITGLSELPLTLAELERRSLVVRDGDRYAPGSTRARSG
jgi:hypothetical protein